MYLYVMRPWFETIDRSLVFQKREKSKVAVASHSSKKKDQKWRISWPLLFYIVTEGIWHWQSSLPFLSSLLIQGFLLFFIGRRYRVFNIWKRVLFLPKLRLVSFQNQVVLLVREVLLVSDLWMIFESHFENYFSLSCNIRPAYPRIFSTLQHTSCCSLLERYKLLFIINKKHS